MTRRRGAEATERSDRGADSGSPGDPTMPILHLPTLIHEVLDVPRHLIYFIGVSIDGFIAGPGGDMSAFPVTPDVVEFLAAEYPETLPSPVRAALGIDVPNSRFDTVIQGRATCAAGLAAGVTSPFAHRRQYVVSRSLGASPDPAVTLVSDDPRGFVHDLKQQNGRDIYLAGGGNLAGQLLEGIDRLVVKSYPILLGAGTPLLTGGPWPVTLELTDSRALTGGTVVSSYARQDR